MARATRIALDMALVSLSAIRPVVIKLWSATKNAVQKTSIKPLVCNSVVEKTETILDYFTDKLISAMTKIRDRQLPKEKEYLEKELKKVEEKISKN